MKKNYAKVLLKCPNFVPHLLRRSTYQSYRFGASRSLKCLLRRWELLYKKIIMKLKLTIISNNLALYNIGSIIYIPYPYAYEKLVSMRSITSRKVLLLRNFFFMDICILQALSFLYAQDEVKTISNAQKWKHSKFVFTVFNEFFLNITCN